MSLDIVCLPTSVFAPELAPATDAMPTYEYLRAADTLTPTDHGSTPLALLPQALANSDVWALVPVSRLSWHAVALPKGVGQNSPRLRTVLGSLLEDRLLDDPGQLHLAISQSAFTDANKTAMHWVAACDKAWLHSHLNALKSTGITVTRIVPEFAPTTGMTQMHVVGTADQQLLVATGQLLGGVTCLPFNGAALALLTRALGEAGQAAETVQIAFAEPAVADVAERLFPGGVSLQNKHARWLEAARSNWDLAQFDLASTGRTRTLKRVAGAGRELLQSRRWRFARWAAVVLLLANVFGLNALAWKEKSAQQTQRLAIQNTLTQTFPQVKVVVDAPLQMQREVLVLQQATGASSAFGLEAALNAVGALGLEGRTIGAIEMKNGEIRLAGLELSPQEVASLSAKLASQGLTALGDGDALLIKQRSPKDATP
jgi:general secretion pathway protein L